jgi:hypothetical protein
MDAVNPVKPKKLGRPKTGQKPRNPIVGVRFRVETIRALDKAAEEAGELRSEMVRRLVESALDNPSAKKT